jgi:hypothetical protein
MKHKIPNFDTLGCTWAHPAQSVRTAVMKINRKIQISCCKYLESFTRGTTYEKIKDRRLQFPAMWWRVIFWSRHEISPKRSILFKKLQSVTFHKTIISIFTAARTLNSHKLRSSANHIADTTIKEIFVRDLTYLIAVNVSTQIYGFFNGTHMYIVSPKNVLLYIYM